MHAQSSGLMIRTTDYLENMTQRYDGMIKSSAQESILFLFRDIYNKQNQELSDSDGVMGLLV